ncbi:MAG TPA: nuclear transport factor 2 family protein [Terriglobales bacterium]|nr:nuclear transport factor 2 family protein [Terriglobales bacterium]
MILLSCTLTAKTVAQTPAPSKPPTALEQTLMSAEKNFIAAAKKGDAAFFKHTLTDDFSWVGFDGQLGDRQDMIDELSEGGLDLLAYDMKVVSVTDSVAIVTYDVVLRVPPSEDEGPPPRYQHFSTVWVKQGDGWKMKFQQMTVSHWGDW